MPIEFERIDYVYCVGIVLDKEKPLYALFLDETLAIAYYCDLDEAKEFLSQFLELGEDTNTVIKNAETFAAAIHSSKFSSYFDIEYIATIPSVVEGYDYLAKAAVIDPKSVKNRIVYYMDVQ